MNPDEIDLDVDDDDCDVAITANDDNDSKLAIVSKGTEPPTGDVHIDDEENNDDDDADAAAAIAAQMGFSSFGPQVKEQQQQQQQQRPAKRVKRVATSSNSTPLGASRARGPMTEKPALSSSLSIATATASAMGTTSQPQTMTTTNTAIATDSSVPISSIRDVSTAMTTNDDDQADPETVAEVADTSMGDSGGGGGGGSERQLPPAVRTDERGDTVYWDASFIEDPWAGLEPQRWRT